MTVETETAGGSPRHLFGPVPSRRLGRSLGIDLVPFKTCSYDCIYCQLGRTTNKTWERRPYVPAGAVTAELGAWLEADGSADYLTLSGSGEPTLNSELAQIITWLKDHTPVPLAVLTNGSLLHADEVRQALRPVDVLVPSLDAATPATFERINRPASCVRMPDVINGLAAMRQELAGEMWIEVMLVAGVNDSPQELEAIRDVVDRVQPDRVQINTVVRPPAEASAAPVSDEGLVLASELLGPSAEVIAPFHSREPAGRRDEDLARSVLELLRRRPCSLTDIAEGLGVHRNWVVKHLEALVSTGRARVRRRGDETYYVAGNQ